MTTLEKLQELLSQGEILAMEEWFKQNKEWDKDVLAVYVAVSIFRAEIEQDEEMTIFDYSLDLKEIISHIYYTKLWMRRFEFLQDVEACKEAYQCMKETKVSNTMLIYLMNGNLFYKKRFAQFFSEVVKEVEGNQSLRGFLFEQIAKQLQEEAYE